MNNPTALGSFALPAEAVKEAGGPRICMPTTRNFSQHAFRSASYEAEDVLADCAKVDFLNLSTGKHFAALSRLQWRLLYKDVSHRMAYFNPGLRPVRVEGDYDALVLLCPLYSDPLYINAVRDWKARCKISVCWIDELMPFHVPQFRHWLHLLREFDFVFLGTSSAVDAVSDAIGKRCHYLPQAVDAERFCPFPDIPERTVDIYSIGRRAPAVHANLLELASKRRLFYIHDTLQNLADSPAADHRAHRTLLSNIAKRSRLFAVAPGFVDTPEKTRNHVELSFRYFEGSAAGAVLIGQAPDTDAFRQCFDWPDVVIPIRPDGSDAAKVVAGLLDDPERRLQIGWRNAREVLLRHDWLYRWKQIFATAALGPSHALQAREKRLQALANSLPTG